MTLPISDTATVTMTMHDFRKLERDREALEARIAELESDSHTPAETSPDVARWRQALQDALPIIQYAVGNLNPESYRDWPAGELWSMSDHLVDLFPDDADLQSLAITFKQFAAEAEDLDDFRAERRTAAVAVMTHTEDQDNATKTDDSP